MTYQPKSSANLYPGGLDASGISGYKQLIKPPLTVATEVDLTEDVINTDGEVLMQAFVSPALGIDEIAAGDWVFRVFGYVDTVDGDSEIVIRVYKRDAAGSETELFNTTTGALTASAAGYTVTESESAFSLSATTDRLVVKFYANTSSTGTRTIHLFYMGAGRQTRLSMPTEITVVPGGDMLSSLYDSDLDGQISGGGGSGGHTIQDDGTPMTARSNLNFAYGFTVTDDAGNDATKVDVTGASASVDPWISSTDTWALSSSDDPIFVVTVDADVTALIGVGYKVKFTQDATTKYGIVHAVGAYSGGYTPLTIYGGTDYVITGNAITNPCYSYARSPIGFPMDPAKWTVEVTDISLQQQSSPTAGKWYNLGGLSINIPVGCWNVTYMIAPQVNSAASHNSSITLSTATNSETNVDLTASFSGNVVGGCAIYKKSTVLLSAKTTYYINMKIFAAGVTNMFYRNDNQKMIIKAICAYL